MLEIKSLSMRYGAIQALREVDFSVAPGEVHCLLGPNGAGKTTLASGVMGLIQPSSGSIRVDGIDIVHDRRRLRAQIGYAPQEIAIYPTVSVIDNLRFFASRAGIHGKEQRRQCEEVAESVAINALVHRRAGGLSGGEKRRLHTAIALLGHPSLILLDEPTAGVDADTRVRLLERVKALADEGCAVTYSTHYFSEVETLAGNVTILREGAVVASGTLSAVLALNGQPKVFAKFESLPEDLAARTELACADNVIAFEAPDMETAFRQLWAIVGQHASSLLSIQVIQPNLETAYLSLVHGADRSPIATDA